MLSLPFHFKFDYLLIPGVKIILSGAGEKDLPATMKMYFTPHAVVFDSVDEVRAVINQIGAQFGFTIEMSGNRLMCSRAGKNVYNSNVEPHRQRSSVSQKCGKCRWRYFIDLCQSSTLTLNPPQGANSIYAASDFGQNM